MSSNEKDAKSLIVKKNMDFERIIHAAFFIVFLVLIILQTAIFFPSINFPVIGKDSLIGVPIGKEEYLYNEGAIVLTLLDFESYPVLKVLVNGEEKAAFLGRTVNINVKDGDVVEMDGSKTNANTSFAVTSISPDIDRKYLGKTFIVGREVMKIFKVRLTS